MHSNRTQVNRLSINENPDWLERLIAKYPFRIFIFSIVITVLIFFLPKSLFFSSEEKICWGFLTSGSELLFVAALLSYFNKTQKWRNPLSIFGFTLSLTGVLGFLEAWLYLLQFNPETTKFICSNLMTALPIVLSTYFSLEMNKINNTSTKEHLATNTKVKSKCTETSQTKTEHFHSDPHYLYSIYFPSGTIIHVQRLNDELLDKLKPMDK